MLVFVGQRYSGQTLKRDTPPALRNANQEGTETNDGSLCDLAILLNSPPAFYFLTLTLRQAN